MPNQPCTKLEVTLRSLVPFTPLAHIPPARSDVVHDIATHYHETLIFQRFRRCEDLLSRHLATLRAKRPDHSEHADLFRLLLNALLNYHLLNATADLSDDRLTRRLALPLTVRP